jgi:polyisoprenoid-binding protein YceI
LGALTILEFTPRRRKSHSFFIAVFALLAVVSVPAFAQQHTIEFLPTETAIHFSLKTSLHTVHGAFRLKSGNVTFDPSTGKLDGLVVVDAASGESGNSGRDSKMHKDILESQKYPEITFAPSDLQGDLQMQSDSQIQVRGTFHLHGSDHQILIPVTVHISGSDLTVDSNFDIPYISWGLKNPSTFILRASNTVQLNVHAVGKWMQIPAN